MKGWRRGSHSRFIPPVRNDRRLILLYVDRWLKHLVGEAPVENRNVYSIPVYIMEVTAIAVRKPSRRHVYRREIFFLRFSH